MSAATYVQGFHDDERTNKMCYHDLGATGMKVSVIGFGAAPLGKVYDADLSDEQGVAALRHALRGGINYIDTAPYYGQGKSEAVLGNALKHIPREAYYIATKVGRYETADNLEGMFDFSAERVTRGVDESLKLLGIEYVDLIQVHDVEFASSVDLIIDETLPALEKIKKQGKAKFIGITGYPIQVLRTIVERSKVKIDSVLSYCHLSLNDSSLLQHAAFFQERNVALISASPLSMALLTDRGPPSWHIASDEIKKACREASVYCRQHGHDISAIALKYSISHTKDVPLTLIGMDSIEQVDKNAKAVEEGSSEEQVQFTATLINRYFSSIEEPGWEGIEVKQYREALSRLNEAKK
ncbi:L-galactose dehydrogenase-like [Lytechinus variegatus]|uniref:L-galactose dehydrogenase-like n=1 Tax=Lytechinus variegatus TaxID=7654 RepID=UPI001BB1BEB7|nr:L-galactose dehydrogenase-like [Lytechinus variegatus]XP_041478555.1 L-galactose dehydrogenase-like [Lytechinus variegatus]